MITFLPGQIKEEHRDYKAGLAVVINHDKRKPEDFGVFIEDVRSEQFSALTGTMAVNMPVDRVYIGVSLDAAKDVARRGEDLSSGKLSLKGIDKELVIPYFLRHYGEKPMTITLVANREGYDVKVE